GQPPTLFEHPEMQSTSRPVPLRTSLMIRRSGAARSAGRDPTFASTQSRTWPFGRACRPLGQIGRESARSADVDTRVSFETSAQSVPSGPTLSLRWIRDPEPSISNQIDFRQRRAIGPSMNTLPTSEASPATPFSVLGVVCSSVLLYARVLALTSFGGRGPAARSRMSAYRLPMSDTRPRPLLSYISTPKA